MARTRLFDPAQGRSFLIFDLPSIGGSGYDLAEALLPLRLPLTLIAGATTATTPEYTLTTEEIKEGLLDLPRKVITDVSVNSITLSRGVYLVDKEFFEWVRMAVNGRAHSDVFRRTLMMVWMHNSFPITAGYPAVSLPFKAWILIDVIPGRYKTGTDFDAKSSEISLQELELVPYDIYEIGASDLASLAIDAAI